MATKEQLRIAASKGFLGHSALLDPDTFAETHGVDEPVGGALVAQNSTNAFGLEDRLTTPITKEKAASNSVRNIRTKARKEQNEKLLKAGVSAEQIAADELANPMDY
jgi:hypothetical protein